MPIYQFQHPLSQEVIELSFKMNDEKTYIDQEGVEWKRVFSPINLAATYRTFDEKRLVDKKGNPLRVQKLSDKFIRSQGFSHADDYIEYNNSKMVDPEKSPEARADKQADILRDKDVAGRIKEEKRVIRERNKRGAQQREGAKKLTASTTPGNKKIKIKKGK